MKAILWIMYFALMAIFPQVFFVFAIGVCVLVFTVLMLDL